MTREQVYEKLKGYLEDMFEVEPDRVTPESHLFEDLDLDSIDAVDLVVKLQDLTGRKFKPEEFKSVRTVGDILDRVQALLLAA
ncbi:acyl carrier protein [Azospirillum thiophilum]|uniref:Acyl carrier protein n=2 Tax=Azospirillum thiophilum TaxID=528244 RepID=A0AAC8ZV16_9PROT|nr:acyl carrier protein [Azospirillum thiophilum]KJR64614.1 acyl carrier protein [Azospirillum thiophilum]